jgi:hypothetical protein
MGAGQAGAGVGGVMGGELGAGLDHQVVQVGPDPEHPPDLIGGGSVGLGDQAEHGQHHRVEEAQLPGEPVGLPGDLDLLADRGRERLGGPDHVQVPGPGGGHGQPPGLEQGQAGLGGRGQQPGLGQVGLVDGGHEVGHGLPHLLGGRRGPGNPREVPR